MPKLTLTNAFEQLNLAPGIPSPKTYWDWEEIGVSHLENTDLMTFKKLDDELLIYSAFYRPLKTKTAILNLHTSYPGFSLNPADVAYSLLAVQKELKQKGYSKKDMDGLVVTIKDLSTTHPLYALQFTFNGSKFIVTSFMISNLPIDCPVYNTSWHFPTLQIFHYMDVHRKILDKIERITNP